MNQLFIYLTFSVALFFCFQIPAWFLLIFAHAKASLLLHMVLSSASAIFLGYLTGLLLARNQTIIAGFKIENTWKLFAGIALIGLFPLLMILLPNLSCPGL